MKHKICSNCKEELPISSFGIHKREKDGLQHTCKDCDKIYRHDKYIQNYDKILARNRNTLNKLPWRRTLNHIKERCNNKNHPKYPRYGGRGIKCLITENELKELWFRDKAYEMKCPSIDREDNNGNYIFSNCKYMELSKNSLKMNLEINAKAVYQISLSGNTINEFISISEATRQTGINNISKVLRGICKTVGGFKWKYKDS